MDALHAYAIALTCVSEFRMAVGFQDAAIAGLRRQGRLGVLARALGSHSMVRLVLADWRLATQAADECLRLSGYVLGAHATPTDGEQVLNTGSALLVLGTIAANLFLSHRTVGSHLYRIFPKLGVRSRAGLAVALNRAPS